jgi:hypothetical protein
LWDAGDEDESMDNRYYLVRKLHYVKEFDQVIESAKEVFTSAYGDNVADCIDGQARQQFEYLLSRLPYIGGDDNPLTHSLIESAWFLAFYKVLVTCGQPKQEAARRSYAAVEAVLKAHNTTLDRLTGWFKFSRIAVHRLKQHAVESQQRKYPDDWVFSVVEGDGQTFDYGIDYTECGICKFFQAQGVAELTTYICRLDFPVSRMLNTGLHRAGTLADGASVCDFRFLRGREVTIPAP